MNKTKRNVGRISKVWMIIVLMSGACFHVSGQILVGPVVGGQVNWVSFQEKSNREIYRSEPSLSFHAGGSASFKMMQKVFLQATILYTQKKKILEGKQDGMFSNKVTYRYIDLPISFTKEVRMQMGEGRYYNLYFGIGPTISYWLGGKGRLTSSDLNENLINPPHYDLNYKIVFDEEQTQVGTLNVRDANRIQLGLNFSAGVVLEPIGLDKFMFTIRYDVGHSYFSSENDGDFGLEGILYYEEDLQSRMRGVSMSLFYFFDLKLEERNKGRSTSTINNKKKKRNR